MPRRSPARRLAALLGAALLVAGVVVAAVLLVLGARYRDRQVEQFARGVVGCTTPLVFTGTGTFYVYAEVESPADAGEGCPADPSPGTFHVDIRSEAGRVPLEDDRTVGYDSDGMIGTSIGRIEVREVGTYEMSVTGPDAGTLAAVGPDPGAIVDRYRSWALIAGGTGAAAGLALLVASSVGSPPATGRHDGAWAPPSPADRRG